MIEKHAEILKENGIIPITCLEIGSRDANDSFFYKNEFNLKDDNIYIVEPNPAMVEQIKNK